VYGNKVLDCEEIQIKYENNTILFEKNSFLDTKSIEGPVDFIIKNKSGDVVSFLPNQNLLNYWIFYISDIFLDDEYYHIEIVKSDSKQKIYNNILYIK
jgi:lipocalin